jgi:hypothetical protein
MNNNEEISIATNINKENIANADNSISILDLNTDNILQYIGVSKIVKKQDLTTPKSEDKNNVFIKSPNMFSKISSSTVTSGGSNSNTKLFKKSRYSMDNDSKTRNSYLNNDNLNKK